MIPVRFLDLKFLHGLAASLAGTSNPQHQQLYDCGAVFGFEVPARDSRQLW
jgi:hypothetical protein